MVTHPTEDDDTPDIELRSLPTYELVDLLDKTFPLRSILLGETIESAHRYAGKRDLIDWLLQWKQDEIESEADPSL